MKKRSITAIGIALVLLCSIWPSLSFAAGITINSGASVTLSGSPTITTVDLENNGTLSAGSGTIRLSGNWTRTGTFTPAASTVSIIGSGASTINNTNTFYNFSCVAASKTINFTAALTQTITNNLTLDGDSSATRITLRSTSSGTQWSLDPQGTRSVDFIDVKDSHNVNTQALALSNSVDSGNNTNWNFGTLAITSDPQAVTPGEEAGPFTVEVQYENGNTSNADIVVSLDSNSTGTFTFSETSGGPAVTTITIPGNSTTGTFFYTDTASGAPLITVSTSNYTSGSQQQTSAAGTFGVAISSPQTAGKEFTLTITAKDQLGNTSTNYSGTVNLTVNYVSPATGTGRLGVTSAASFANGIATITNQTFSDCGSVTITATDAAASTRSGTSANISFRPFDFSVTTANLDVSASGTSAGRHMVNKAFGLNVTARNTAGATCPNYKGNALLTVTNVSPAADQGGILSTTSLTASLWSDGEVTLTDQTYNKWGKINIKAADSALSASTGKSADIFFVPKNFTIDLSSPPSARDFYYTKEGFDATVSANDVNDAVITNYQGTVSFTGRQLNLPTDYTFSVGDSGRHSFSDINGAISTQTNISVNDKAFTAVSGASASITLKEGMIRVLSTSGPVGLVNVQVKIFDANGLVISEDNSTAFTIKIDEFIKGNDSATAEAVNNKVTVFNGIATITINDTEAESISVTPVSEPELTPISGIVRFGTVSGSGVGVQYWREMAPSRPTAGAAGGEEGEEEDKEEREKR